MVTDGIEETRKALSEAKFGAVISGYLALSYLIQIAYVYSGGKDTFGNIGLTTLISDIVGIIVAAFLTWRILVRQPLWAAIIVALWFAAEMVGKIAAIASGEQHINVNASSIGIIIMLMAFAVGAIVQVWGSWKLRLLRRSADSQQSLAR